MLSNISSRRQFKRAEKMSRFLAFVLFYLISTRAIALPMELKQGPLGSGVIELAATFDGVNIPMVFDTGSSGVQLLKATWNAEYPVLRQEVRRSASGVTFTCDVISIQKISLEGFEQQGFEADRCELEDAPQLLSLHFFDENVLYFDFSNNRLDLNNPDSRGILPLRTYSRGHVALGLVVAGEQKFGVFDTGAGLSSVDLSFAESHSDEFEFLQDIDGNDAGGKPIKLKLFKLKTIEINGLLLTDEVVLAFDFGDFRDYFGADVPIILGFNIITKFNWTIDLRNSLWSVEPKKD